MAPVRVVAFLLVSVGFTIAGAGMAGAGGFDDGMAALRRLDTATAVSTLRAAAEAGDPRAQTALAELYLTGRGVPLSALVAVRWLRRAVAQDNAKAQTRLGLLLLNGRGVRADSEQAAQFIRLAAMQGHADAQACLGGLYAMGVGVARDPVSAYVWYSLAAAHPAQGKAAANRDLYRARLTAAELDLAYRRIERGGLPVLQPEVTSSR
jgi:TPR repeat protein